MDMTHVQLGQLKENVACGLCFNFLVDAVSIVDCLHSFCRSCLLLYLESDNTCPRCGQSVHVAGPLTNVRPDRQLQDLVNGLLARLCTEERTHQYREKQAEAWAETESDRISVCLEHRDSRGQTSSVSHCSTRYLLCPASVTVSLLHKFIRYKFDIGHDCKVAVYCGAERLASHATLNDIICVYRWKKWEPLRLLYAVETGSNTSSVAGVPGDVEQRPDRRQHQSSDAEASGRERCAQSRRSEADVSWRTYMLAQKRDSYNKNSISDEHTVSPKTPRLEKIRERRPSTDADGGRSDYRIYTLSQKQSASDALLTSASHRLAEQFTARNCLENSADHRGGCRDRSATSDDRLEQHRGPAHATVSVDVVDVGTSAVSTSERSDDEAMRTLNHVDRQSRSIWAMLGQYWAEMDTPDDQTGHMLTTVTTAPRTATDFAHYSVPVLTRCSSSGPPSSAPATRTTGLVQNDSLGSGSALMSRDRRCQVVRPLINPCEINAPGFNAPQQTPRPQRLFK